MDSVVGALWRLQGLPATLALLRHISEKTTSSQGLILGGPQSGYYAGSKDILAGLISKKAAKRLGCEVGDAANGITTRTSQDVFNTTELTQSNLEALMAKISFLPQRPRDSKYPPRWLRLSTGRCRILPFCLRVRAQGREYQPVPWLVPTVQVAVLPCFPAGRPRRSCNSQAMPKNVGVCYWKKWLQREKFVMLFEYIRSWVREEGATFIPVFTKEDNTTVEIRNSQGAWEDLIKIHRQSPRKLQNTPN
ncbi:hypothetical protein B0T18DRAFT_462397 [Schizothecium vesticola]|uniref:Uncharacterized protein n=1 Tax=Schizothecium vesticola TaxID=314040 RepID=A0AA40F2X3_9PEZI|nr:hypothetical protein B0T18DRAFT_462397 [Schizothecium vesticola]